LGNRTVTGLKLTEVSYNPGVVTPKHRHENAGFCLVLHGTYSEDYSKKILECAPQTVTYSPAGEEHLNRFHRAAVRCFIIDVEAVWLKRARQCGVILDNPVDFHTGSLVWLATRIYNEYKNMDDASPLVIEALILEMLVGVSRGSKIVSDRRPPRWLRQARVFIHEHFSRKFSLKEIASVVGVHPIYLASEFRRHYQCTVGEYVRRLRVENACREMTKSKTSLVEIALAAGFSSQSHFSSVFKQITGMTPATYRANTLQS
jgi:AraC family transcriptional regulator